MGPSPAEIVRTLVAGRLPVWCTSRTARARTTSGTPPTRRDGC